MSLPAHAPEIDRVRANTWPPINERIDLLSRLRLSEAAAAGSPDEVGRRLSVLDDEWDFDRVLETEVSTMGLLGLVLGLTVDRRLLVLPAFAAAMMVVHSTHGWYPLLPLFRRLGVRTRDEIDRERYGLKAIRGDFAVIPPAGAQVPERAAAAWKAVNA